MTYTVLTVLTSWPSRLVVCMLQVNLCRRIDSCWNVTRPTNLTTGRQVAYRVRQKKVTP